jgi:1-aminocyclopropane-1-carboxylate deaminase/D-cysteine desulfhydrase-like pyridoxal-dependent ACC family enzyme
VSLEADARTATWLRLFGTLIRGRLDPAGGSRPLWIPPGGSSALGVLGAAEGALEVVEDARAGRISMPEVVVVAAGSCGTAAGLAIGFALARAPVRVVAVRVVPRLVANRRKILRLARGGLRILRRSGMAAADEVVLGSVDMVHAEAGGGYAKPTPAGELAAARATTAGVAAETTYTGKAWAHLFSGALSDRRVLFWNTFGGR